MVDGICQNTCSVRLKNYTLDKKYLKNELSKSRIFLKIKTLGAVLDLPADQHSQSSPISLTEDLIGSDD